MMRVVLCFFFNYPFERNIDILEKLYANRFDNILHIQPLVRTDRENVHTVYRAAFNFGGFFSDSFSFLKSFDADYYVFSGDDCLINPDLFGENFEDVFLKGNDDIACFIPKILKLCDGNELNHNHKFNALSRFARGYGLYDQRIEGWRRFLPDSEQIARVARDLDVYSDRIKMPPDKALSDFTPAQQEVIESLMGEGKEASLPYPLVFAISDFFIVSRRHLEKFCHNVGLFAAMNIFPEIAVPTALLTLPGKIIQANDLGLTFDWTWGRNKNIEHYIPTSLLDVQRCVEDMGSTTLFRHPVKLSKVNLE